jgi:HPr kinase/phosphorylase
MNINVAKLLTMEAKHLDLKLIYGKNLIQTKEINGFKIQKPGLALAGYTKHIHDGLVQILGETEISYLWSLGPKDREKAINNLCCKDIPCLVVTKNLKIPYEIIKIVKACKIPLLKTQLDTENAIISIQNFLESKLAPYEVLHGNFMDVYGIGILIIGRSGIGKSECALELVNKGHRLIADDSIIVRLKQNQLIGKGDETFQYFIELRGLGIINIKDIFGVSSITREKVINLVIKFIDWGKDTKYDRLGLDESHFKLFSVRLPLITLPVYPGRDMSVLVETAAKNYLLKSIGKNVAEEFNKMLIKKISENREMMEKIKDSNKSKL